jgi:hypothetical protein
MYNVLPSYNSTSANNDHDMHGYTIIISSCLAVVSDNDRDELMLH